ncbi:FIG00679443: hypothetical protein [hydrothermal vent metagenome]|uniref:Transposase IS200-like domain-containing protein n=1 Tax=hydrothermal vent metagenome TaxID=652676 RepID=A0A3B1D053_9ZZZZ
MARPLRIEYKGAVYHILSRGNQGEEIFSDDSDREYFVEILQRAKEKYGIEVYAYCIMGNHYHLLISTPEGELTKAMHFIGSSYGSYLRRYRGLTGHVFAGRYKSLCVEKDSYLLELSRYIHLNPVRAGIVKSPERYPWSSYRYYIGKKTIPDWLSTEWLIDKCGKRLKTRQRKYREYVEAGIKNQTEYPVEKIVGQAILGSKEFVKKVLKGLKKTRKLKDVTAKKAFEGKIELDELYQEVSEYYGIKDLRKSEKARGSDERRAQEMFVYLAKEHTSALNREIAARVGDISASAVSHQYKRTGRKMEGNQKSARQWRKEVKELASRFKG